MSFKPKMTAIKSTPFFSYFGVPVGADKAGGTAVKFYELRDNLVRFLAPE